LKQCQEIPKIKMSNYHIKSGVNWGEKSEVENLTPIPTNSSSLSQSPQSTQGIGRLNFESAIASLTLTIKGGRDD
jgi:hypothetical protein